MKPAPLTIGAVIIILGIGYFATNNPSSDPQVATPETNDVEIDEQINSADSDTNDNQTTEPDSSNTGAISPVSGTYDNFSPEKIANSEAEHILLFFHATWCPSCRALDNDITANLESIPAGVEIYKLDYDTETDLKRQYGVTTQHSVIEINQDGSAVSSISHPLNFEGLISTI